MKRAAIGVRAHSGWAALVAVAGKPGAVQLLDRRRIVIADPQVPGTKQPYHFAEKLELQAAKKHLASCTTVSRRLALAAFRDVVQELNGYEIAGAAILLASGRPLPSLPEILASHALIHTAEGEFFRQAVRQACEHLGICVKGIRERELGEGCALSVDHAQKEQTSPFAQAQVLDSATSCFQKRGSLSDFSSLQQEIAHLGKTVGPPWTQDQKMAAFAAMLVLVS
jgi:hypothetical protein